MDATDHDPVVVVGDIAHIEAASDRGPRARVTRAARERDEYDNLVLLCKNCHARLDGQKTTNTVEIIKRMREDHEDWVRASLPEVGSSGIRWTAVILEGAVPLDRTDLAATVAPDNLVGAPVVVAANTDGQSWEEILAAITSCVGGVFESEDEFAGRLAVFPLAPVSACVALGYVLTNRPRVRLFQYHRDEQTWSWPRGPVAREPLAVRWLGQDGTEASNVAILFELSGPISDDAINELGISFDYVVRITAAEVGSGWLRAPEQLVDLGRTARDVLEACSRLAGGATWHLFFAGPAPAAVCVGQQLSPNLSGTVALYEFSQTRKPRYQRSLTLNEPRK